MTDQSSKRRTQEERKAESQREIIKSAIRIFSRQGTFRTTLNEVGEEAGYTGGLVSHRFGSKLGLIKAVINSWMRPRKEGITGKTQGGRYFSEC